MRIRITTNRLPQPDRHNGAEIDVPHEKAASLIAQGFAVALDEPAEDAPRRGRKVKA